MLEACGRRFRRGRETCHEREVETPAPSATTKYRRESCLVLASLAHGRSRCSSRSVHRSPAPALAEPPKAPLIKLPVTFGAAMENTPFVFGDRPLLALNYRDDTKNNTDGYKASMYLFIRDLCTGQEIARFGEGHSFVNAFVNGPELNVFASEGTNRDWFQSIYRFTSDRPEDVEAGTGDSAGGRRASVQLLGLPRRPGVLDGLRVEPAGADSASSSRGRRTWPSGRRSRGWCSPAWTARSTAPAR